MDDPKTIESSGAYGIPKWIMKKGMRYEVDDFIVSPPSNEDGGFMRLRFGRCPSPRHQLSSLDQPEADMGMIVEVRKSSSVISGLEGSDGESSPNPGPTITFGRGVLSAEATPFTTPATTPEALLGAAQSSPQHLPPSPLPDTERATNSEACSQVEKSLKVPEEPSRPSVSTSESIIISTFRKISGTKPPIQHLLNEEEYEKRLELEESVKSLAITGTPDTTPNPTPKTSPVLQRKLSNIVMETTRKTSTTHSYFCTKPFQPQNTDQPSSGEGSTSVQEGVIGGATLSSSAAAGTQLMDEGAKLASTLDAAGHFMGKRRQRPKPSALREMNFWAPTSM